LRRIWPIVCDRFMERAAGTERRHSALAIG
jgi:hypothetical protein